LLRKTASAVPLSVIRIGLVFLCAVMPLTQVFAQQRTFIRDAEIEAVIRDMSEPVFRAAGLNPEAVNVYLVQDSTLNAFVAGGQNLFIHTGLLTAAERPLEVLGVIAHEAGHIAAGHLVQRRLATERASTTAIATLALGILGAIASGRGDVAGAVIGGGQGLAVTNLLAFSRSQEQSADQAAVNFLHSAGYSAQGLLDFTGRLKGQEVLLGIQNRNPYLSTHPLTNDRLNFLENQVRQERGLAAETSNALQARYDRVRAKLAGFLYPESQVYRDYPTSDTSVPARYARAIAAYRAGRIDDAIRMVQDLMVTVPDDPYFEELLGQMLFEYGRIDESLPYLEAALDGAPDAVTIRLLLARAQIEANRPDLDRAAERNLRQVTDHEPSGLAWRLLATAYGRQGKDALVALAMAEYNLSRGEFRQSAAMAKRAQQLLPTGSREALQAQDVLIEAERRLRQQ